MKTSQRAHRKLSLTNIKATTDRVRCLLTNATIDLPEYSSTAFRLGQIQQAKQLLSFLEVSLQAQDVVEIAMK